MASSMQGLRVKPKYEDLIGVAVSDELRNIKFPNRDASFLRNGFILSQLDGEGQRAMERQQEMASKEAYKEHLLKEIAKNTGANLHDLRNDHHQELQSERVNNALYFDIGDDMDDDAGVGIQAGVQTDRPSASSSGVQTDRPPASSSGVQTDRQSRNNQETQATEDRSEEIERLKDEQEARIREMERNNERRISNLINQVRSETMTQTIGEAEQIHQEKMREMQLRYEHQMLEMAQDNNLTKRQAKHIIQETEAQARAEAQQFTGNVFSYAEQQHLQRTAELRKEKEEANQRARKAENRANNVEHKNERTPDNRPKAKPKSGPSPKKGLPPVPPYPTGEQASGSQEQPKYDNPESNHEAKGKPGRPPTVKKEGKTKQQTKKEPPKHDTELDESRSKSHWKSQTRGYLVDQLSKRGWKWPKDSAGKNVKLIKKDLTKIMTDMLGL